MKKFVKSIIIFIGGIISGFAICGTLIAKVVKRTDSIREGLKRAITDKINFWLFGDSYRSCAKRYDKPYQIYGKRYDVLETIIFESREKAEVVLEELLELIRCYGYASVANLYDLVDLKNNVYTNNYYGWTCLDTVKVERVRDGYILNLPKPVPIK